MVVIDAPIERVWAVLADIEGQPRWMHDMKAVRILTRRADRRRHRSARRTVRILGISVTDPVTITEFQPPTRFALTHDGMFKGGGVIDAGGRRGRHDDDRALGRDAHPAGPAAPRRGRRAPDPRRRSSRRTSSGCATSSKARRPTRVTGLGRRPCSVHLVDATYELFRAHFAPRPPVLGRDGIPLSGVSGLCDQLLFLLREQGATHVGCATDRVIESLRNDLYPGYKSSAGMPPELLAQFPIAEAAIEALGLVLWPMVEFEADDAIAAAAVRFGADPRVERILICTPDKDMAQLVRDDRVVLWDRRRDVTYDDAGVREKWGVAPTVDPGLAGARRRLVGRLPGAARLGRQVRGGGAPALRPLRGHPAEGVGLGGPGHRRLAGDGAGGDAARPLGRGAAVPRPRPPPDDRGRRPDPPDRRRRAALGRRAAGRVGGVLRGMGPRPAPVKAPSVGVRGLTRSLAARRAMRCQSPQ